MANQRITSKLRIVALDETPYWAEDIVAKAGKIQRVYLYDAAVQVHMAEITPSCCLTPLYFITEKEIDDDTHEEMSRQETREEYVWASSLEAMKPMDAGKKFSNFRFTNSESKHYKGHFDAAVEYFSGNHPM